MGFQHPAHPWSDPELDRHYARDEREEDRQDLADKAGAGAACHAPQPAATSQAAPSEGTAEAGPPPSPPQSPDATPLKDRAAYIQDWLDECDGGPMRQRLLALMAELRFEQGLDRYADEGTK